MLLTLVNVMALSLKNGSNFRAILWMNELLNMDTNNINLCLYGGREREIERDQGSTQSPSGKEQ